MRLVLAEVQEDGGQQWYNDRDSPCPQQVAEARGPSLERGCGSLRDDDGGADSHDAVSDDRGNAADASRRLLHADIHDHRVDRPRQ